MKTKTEFMELNKMIKDFWTIDEQEGLFSDDPKLAELLIVDE